MASISRGLRFLPLLWALLLIVNVITSRLIANSSYVQDPVRTSGFLLVESTFSELLDLLAFVGLASIIVRYLHLEMVTHGLKGEFQSSVSRLRLASLSFGVGSMMGITVISNFRQPNQQEQTEVPGTVHYVGRILVGVCGITYCLLQTVITFYLSKLQINTVRLFVLRIVTSSLLCVSGLIHVTMDVWLAIRLLKENTELYKPWYSNKMDTEASVTDVIGDVSEWMMFLLFAVFSSTYFQEFRDLGVEMNCFSNDDEKTQANSVKDYSMLKHRESESSDQD
ncbi:hypothetical protein ACROYT_G019837 [Oculina patagonica]